MGIKKLLTEIASIKRIFSLQRQAKSIVFYSESSIYYLYFEGLINYILCNSEYDICYITSDINDPVFELESERFKVYYINNLLLSFFSISLDAKVFIMTMTDLNQFHIKRSTKNVNHIYVFHAIMSTHMIYRKGAFDHYDTIFCVGHHHVEEIRATEKLYGLKEKQLVEVGYHWLEKIHAEHREFKKNCTIGNKPLTILIAPSWNEGNIIETCIDDLTSLLLKAGYQVVLRPHPEIFKRKKDIILHLQNKYGDEKLFQLETKLTSAENFHRADVLITDWSGIAFEYAFGTERPVLFINTPRKVHNSEFEKIDIEPFEIKLRNVIGITLDMDKINNVVSEIDNLLSTRSSHFKEKIIEQRKKYIFNWGHSSEVGGKYLLNYIKSQAGENEKA